MTFNEIPAIKLDLSADLQLYLWRQNQVSLNMMASDYCAQT